MKSTVLIALAMLGAPAPAAAPCEASVHAELARVEPKETVTTHTYDVEITTLEPCGTIHFTLQTTERLSRSKVTVVETRGELRLRHGSASRVLSYDLPHGREMVKWEVKLTGCERCEP